VVFPAFYESSRLIIIMAEVGLIFILAHKLFIEKWYHAAWKSAFIFMTLYFSLKLVLIATQEVLALIYD